MWGGREGKREVSWGGRRTVSPRRRVPLHGVGCPKKTHIKLKGLHWDTLCFHGCHDINHGLLIRCIVFLVVVVFGWSVWCGG